MTLSRRKFAEVLQRSLDINELDAQALAAATIPTVALADLEDPIYHSGRVWTPWIATDQIAATAAEFSHIGLFMPDGAGVLAHLEDVTLASAVEGDLLLLNINAAFGNVITTMARDFRQLEAGINTPQMTCRNLTQAAALGLTEIITVRVTNEPFTQPLDLILTPGNGVVARPLNNNQDIRATFRWREYRPPQGVRG